MTSTGSHPSNSEGIRYEPDDPCPPLVLLGVGLQGVMLILASIVLIVAVTARSGGQDGDYLDWAVFAALIISGALIALQASRIWRFGAGHILFMGPTTNFVAVSVLALEAGGPALLASLTVAASLFYLMLAFWLPLLRRIITPAVSGTVLMLIAVSILPIALERVREVPEGAEPTRGPLIALVTLAVTVVLALRAPRSLKPWSPLLALVAGCVDGRGARRLRHPAGDRRRMGRDPLRRVPRAGPDPRSGLLDAAPGIRCGDPRGRRQEHGGQRRRAAGLDAHAQGYRLSTRAGRAQHERPRPTPAPDRNWQQNARIPRTTLPILNETQLQTGTGSKTHAYRAPRCQFSNGNQDVQATRWMRVPVPRPPPQHIDTRP